MQSGLLHLAIASSPTASLKDAQSLSQMTQSESCSYKAGHNALAWRQLFILLTIALPIKCGMPTMRAFPMQNARLTSVMPVSVQPLGKP